MRLNPEQVLDAISRLHAGGRADVGPGELLGLLSTSPATLRRHLDALVRAGRLHRTGRTKSTRYRIVAAQPDELGSFVPSSPAASDVGSFVPSSPAASDVGAFVQSLPAANDVAPSTRTLLPEALAHELDEASRRAGAQAPAVPTPRLPPALVFDVSWSSSRLEGNPIGLHAALELMRSGREHGTPDEQMLLNHRRTIEFACEHVPGLGVTGVVLRGMHDLLVLGLGEPGFDPELAPAGADATLEAIANQARGLASPVQAAFHLWTALSCARLFASGNGPCARVAASLPLLLSARPPLSFLHVTSQDYDEALARARSDRDFSLAVELFADAYRRSLRTAAAMAAQAGALRSRH